MTSDMKEWANDEIQRLEKLAQYFNFQIPERLKDPSNIDRHTFKLRRQLWNHYNRIYMKIKQGKTVYAICDKCRDIHVGEDGYSFIGRYKQGNLYITESSMVRMYVKGRLYIGEARGVKKWYPIGWICPSCLNIILDKELLELKNKEDVKWREMKEKIGESINRIKEKANL
jgi:hypothetical protein